MYKPHFYKQNQAEIGKKIKQKLSNTPRLNLQKKPQKSSVYVLMRLYDCSENDNEKLIT